MTTKHIRAALALAVGAFILSAPDGALAAPTLRYDGCLSRDGSGGLCFNSGDILRGAGSVALSPDGKSLYVAGNAANAVTVYSRVAGGLAYQGCFSNAGDVCTKLPGRLSSPEGIAVSPDGSNVYVGTATGVTVFGRSAGGQLSYAGCVSDDGSGGLCADAGRTVRYGVSLAVSPDGKSVYEAGYDESAVVAFDRAPGGQITFAGCVSSDGSAGRCADAPGKQIRRPAALALSPDGRTLYVAADQQHAVDVLDRAPGGQLTFASCVSNDGANGDCATVPANVLTGAHALALSADGKSLYVGAGTANAVSVFDRGPSGQITYGGCVGDGALPGVCADPPGTPLSETSSVRLSADGRTLFAAGRASHAIAMLARSPDGRLGYAGCVSDDGSSGLCTDLPGSPLNTVSDLAVTPDGNALYVTGYEGGTLSVLLARTVPETTIDGGPADGAEIATARPTFALSSDEAGATFECSLDGGRFASCGPTATFGTLGEGPHRIAFRAVLGDEVDPTPASRSFRVDLTGPSVSITRAPERKVKSAKRKVRVTFAFSSPEPGASLTCRLDRRAARACSSPAVYVVGRGKHTFSVVAADSLGNRGTAATARFDVVRKRARRARR